MYIPPLNNYLPNITTTNLTSINWTSFLSIKALYDFWYNQTYGLFPILIASIMLGIIYLKTRSASLTFTTAVLLIILRPMFGWLSFIAAALLAYLVYRSLYKR